MPQIYKFALRGVDVVELRAMTEEVFRDYYENAVREYAADHVKAGNWKPEEALALSRREFEELLPNGVASPDQYLYSVWDTATGDNVGLVWYALKKNRGAPYAFIYDFVIYESFRRKGYGEQTLRALEEVVKPRGIHEIELHVFGYNTGARALYEKSGYEATNIRMLKKLD